MIKLSRLLGDDELELDYVEEILPYLVFKNSQERLFKEGTYIRLTNHRPSTSFEIAIKKSEYIQYQKDLKICLAAAVAYFEGFRVSRPHFLLGIEGEDPEIVEIRVPKVETLLQLNVNNLFLTWKRLSQEKAPSVPKKNTIMIFKIDFNVTGDDILLADELQSPVTVTGTTDIGNYVYVVVSGQIIASGMANSDGTFSLTITPSQLAMLLDGPVSFSFNASDSYGGSVNNSRDVIIDSRPL